MPRPVVIAVAITGSVPRKKDNPALPVTPSEQIESTHEAFEAGAALVHIHVRNPDESSSSDPKLFAQVQEGVRKHCPGMIVQFSTGGRGRSQEERGAALSLRPEMASLATGSVNFPTSVYENPPALIEHLARTMLEYDIKPEIEIFDLAMLYNTRKLVDRGLLREPVHVQFVMGIQNALPARRNVLEFMVSELQDVLPTATWTGSVRSRGSLPRAPPADRFSGPVLRDQESRHELPASSSTTEQEGRTVHGFRRFRCRDCGRRYNERTGTVLNRVQVPTDIVFLVVFWRLRYKLSLRDLAEMFLIRGFVFTHEAVRDWEAKLAPLLAEGLRKRRAGKAGRCWHVDET